MNQQYQYRPNFNYQRNSSNYLRQVSDDNNLYSSSEGFTLGNMFKDSYIPYKNYTPQVLTPTSEQDDLFLRLSEQEFAAHDLNLYLDLNPQDGNMLEIFNQYRKEANNLLNSLIGYTNDVLFFPMDETFPFPEIVIPFCLQVVILLF